MKRLSLATLGDVPASVVKPFYDPRKLGVGIVHLGIGAFYRAQAAVYTDDAIALEGGDWGICGVSLRSPDVRDRLAPQEGIYTAVEKSPAGVRRRQVRSPDGGTQARAPSRHQAHRCSCPKYLGHLLHS